MAILQLPDGRWKVDVEPIKGRRFRKTFKTKAEASRFEATCRSKVIDTPDWSPRPKDRRKLSELVQLWYDLHGHSLRDGKPRKNILDALAVSLRNPVASRLSPQVFADFRRLRLEQGMSGKTLNNEQGYLFAVYSTLSGLGVIDYPNPLASVKRLKLQERELSWLSKEQIVELLDTIRLRCANPHVEVIVLICLATGARWSEAQGLKPSGLRNGVITYGRTKSGKVRSVPIAAELESLIVDHWKRHGQFTRAIASFRHALAKVSFKLPRGQATHVLRHSFASHFIQGGGNILTLQRILGHSTVTMTMRYAHLAPDHLADAIRLGPLANFDSYSTPATVG